MDEVGPRFSGTQGNADAVAWALRTLPTLGFTKVSSEPVKVPRWERGPESAEIVAPTRRRMAMLALGGSVATPKGGVDAEVIEARSMEALAAMDPAAVKGKLVFLSAKMERAKDGAWYKIGAGQRVRGPSLAAKLGAAGVLVRSAGTSENRLAHTGMLRYDPALPKIPAAAVSGPDADLLQRLIAAGKPVRVRLTITAKSLPEVDSANVVVDVPGSVVPDEIVLLGAHLDTWDVGMGAQDDGAGCAIVIEAARQIAALPTKPRRTVRVVLFNNEENGGAGSDAYAKAHAAELDRHVMAFEADTGAGRVFRARYLGGEKGQPAFAALTELLAPLGVEASTEAARGGADLASLRAAGVPVIDLFQDMTFYFDVHHTENDTLDKIHKDELDQATAAFTVAAFAAADAPDDFGRVPEDKRAEKR